MPEREHFTNGRCFAFGCGLTLVVAAFGAEVSGWAHWISVGAGYGAGGVVMLLSGIRIARSYFSGEASQPVVEITSGQPSEGSLELGGVEFASEQELRETERQAWVKNIGERLQGALSPLQVEAIELAHDLGEFAKRVEPMPQAAVPHTFDGIMDNALGARWAWICKLQTEYEDKYAPRVVAFTRTLGYAGRHNKRLQHFVEHITDLDSVNTVRAQLWKEAFSQTDIDLQGE